MDPNEALAGMRTLVALVHADDVADPLAHIEAMADQFDALDEWLSNGGFRPTDWRRDASER